jgi:hypothetical protein
LKNDEKCEVTEYSKILCIGATYHVHMVINGYKYWLVKILRMGLNMIPYGK